MDDKPVQTIRATTVDHILEPDAMRGTEQFLRNITDGDGNPITPVDENAKRREAALEAEEARARPPMRMQSPTTMTPASETLVPTAPDWQMRARAAGWSPDEPNRNPPFAEPANIPWDKAEQSPSTPFEPAPTPPAPPASATPPTESV